MRRLTLASTLLLAACATAPQQQQATPQAPAAGPSRLEPDLLLGLTAAVLVGHFGNPALQVREGNSLKIQFRNRRCVLDAYLYPPGNGTGAWKVTHVDTRDPNGADVTQAACIAALESPS
jgi:FtsP/CotA-like multicopper oxidase with cupredoxin domain